MVPYTSGAASIYYNSLYIIIIGIFIGVYMDTYIRYVYISTSWYII